jgi:hypothetical protein
MSDSIEWVAITSLINGSKPIGAVGFINSDLVVAAAFYDGRDANKDGRVDWSERAISSIWGGLEDRGIAEVAIAASSNIEVLDRDPTCRADLAKSFTQFATNLTRQAFINLYFARGVKVTGSALATIITSSMVKGFMVRKGFEAAVKKVLDAGTS